MKKILAALTAMALLILTASIATVNRDGPANTAAQNITAATVTTAFLDMNVIQPAITSGTRIHPGIVDAIITPATSEGIAPTAAAVIPNSVRVSVGDNAALANSSAPFNASSDPRGMAEATEAQNTALMVSSLFSGKGSPNCAFASANTIDVVAAGTS